MEQKLSEVTFHYGAGVRLRLDSDILGIRHAKELLAGFLYKRSCPCSPVYYLFSGIYTSGKAREGLCGYVTKYLNHPPLPGESYIFVSRNHKCLTCLTQTSSGICLESHYLCEGTIYPINWADSIHIILFTAKFCVAIVSHSTYSGVPLAFDRIIAKLQLPLQTNNEF